MPVVGVGAGALLNFKLIDDISEAAHWTYRERFLLEKVGDDVGAAPEDVPPPRSPQEDTTEEVIDVLGIISAVTTAHEPEDTGHSSVPYDLRGRRRRQPSAAEEADDEGSGSID